MLALMNWLSTSPTPASEERGCRPKLWAVAALLCCLAHAQQSFAQATPQMQRLPLSVQVNAQAKPDVFAWMDDKGMLWVAVEDLRKWGLTVSGERELDGQAVAPLSALGKTARFDEEALRLVLDLNPSEELGRTRVQLNTKRRTQEQLLQSGGLRMDYELGATASPGSVGLDGSLTTRARIAGWQLLDERSVVANRGNVKQVYARTTLRRDWPEYATRLDVGSLQSTALGLLGGAPWRGISVGTVQGMNPDITFEGAAQVQTMVRYPSTAEVYVNGIKQGQYKVEPGQLDLEEIRSTSGTADVRVVLKDIYGEETVVENSRYLSQSAVRAGSHEFVYQVGAPEESGQSSLGLRGSHRWGLSDDVTLAAHVLLAPQLHSLQLDAMYQSPLFGALGIGLLSGVSSSAAGSSNLQGYSLAHEYRTTAWSWHAGVSRTPMQSAQGWGHGDLAYFRLTRDLGSLGQWGLSGSRQKSFDDASRDSFEVTWSKHLPGSLLLHLTAGTDTEYGAHGRAWLVWAPKANQSASLTTEAANGRTSSEVSYSQSSDMWEASAWRLSLRDQEGAQSARALIEKGNGPLLLRGQAAISEGHALVRITGQGALLVDGTHAGLARARGDAAVLVETAGLPNVRVYRNGLLAGKTDDKGQLWVSGLVGYEEARLSVDENDIPMAGWYLPQNTLATRPAPGVVAKVSFDLRRIVSFEVPVMLCHKEACTPADKPLELSGTSDLGPQVRGTIKDTRLVLHEAVTGAYDFSSVDGRCKGKGFLSPNVSVEETLKLYCATP